MTRTLEAYINDQLVGVLREAADIWEFDYHAE